MGLKYQFTLADVVNEVCNHPRRYVVTGTLFEVVGFLDGFAGALKYDSLPQGHSVFSPFFRWMNSEKAGSEEFGLPTLAVLDWITFRECFDSEPAAIESFRLLFLEYLKANGVLPTDL